MSDEKFNIIEQMENFLKDGDKIFTCETCLKMRQMQQTEMCPISTMQDLYKIVTKSDKILVF